MESSTLIDKVIDRYCRADIVQSAIAYKAQVYSLVLNLYFLVEALVYAGLAPAWTGSPGSTSLRFFAPTDQAFKDLGTLWDLRLLNPGRYPSATSYVSGASIMWNHVFVREKFTSELNCRNQ